MYDEYLLKVDGKSAKAVASAGLPVLHLGEREHLQEWVLRHPYLLGDGVEIVTSEYDKWQTAKGDPVLDRLDILGLDPDGRLVVAELKRDAAPHTIHMQAINYAAMVSRLRPGDVAELWALWHRTPEGPLDIESTLSELETRWLLTAESIKAPRIVLVAADFPPSVTASVVWLNERGVDITLIRFRSYQLDDGQILVTFSREYPVPNVEEFTIGRRLPKTDATPSKPDVSWDLPSLQKLALQANVATLAMLDLCAADDGVTVSVADIMTHANLTIGQVRGQLAGLTMRLKNPQYGFGQNAWPANVTWLPGGVASYSLDPELAALWRQARSLSTDSSASGEPQGHNERETPAR